MRYFDINWGGSSLLEMDLLGKNESYYHDFSRNDPLFPLSLGKSVLCEKPKNRLWRKGRKEPPKA